MLAKKLCRRVPIGRLGCSLALVALTSCAAPSAPAPAAAPAPAVKEGGTLVVSIRQEVDSLNPILQGFNVAGLVSDVIFDPLVRLGADGKFYPALATQVPTLENGGIAKDGSTYTFALRKNVKFHDGKPFSCADVQYTFMIGKEPTVRATFKDDFAPISSVTCKDDSTAVFSLSKPFPGLISTVPKYGILPKHLYEKEDLNTTEVNTKPVGTGPFVFKEWVKGSHVLTARNPDYFLGRPHLEQVVFKIVLDENALLAQIERGEVDVAYRMAPTAAPVLRNLQGWEALPVPLNAQFFLTWNTAKNPALGDKQVRQALAYASDREAISRLAHSELARPIPASPVPPIHPLFKKDVKDYKYDPQRAKALLDEAGWRVGPDGVRAKGDVKLSFEFGESGKEQIASAELLSSQWKEIGVATKIKTGTSATQYREAQEGKFEVRTTRYSFPYEMDVRFLLKTGALDNYGKWSNAEADRLMDEAAITLDTEKKKQLYHRIQEIFADELPYFPLVEGVNFHGIKKTVHNYKPSPYMLNMINDSWNAYEWWKED